MKARGIQELIIWKGKKSVSFDYFEKAHDILGVIFQWKVYDGGTFSVKNGI